MYVQVCACVGCAHVSLARTDEYASRHAENVDEYANYKRPITQTLRTLRDVKHVISMKIWLFMSLMNIKQVVTKKWSEVGTHRMFTPVFLWESQLKYTAVDIIVLELWIINWLIKPTGYFPGLVIGIGIMWSHNIFAYVRQKNGFPLLICLYCDILSCKVLLEFFFSLSSNWYWYNVCSTTRWRKVRSTWGFLCHWKARK